LPNTEADLQLQRHVGVESQVPAPLITPPTGGRDKRALTPQRERRHLVLDREIAPHPFAAAQVDHACDQVCRFRECFDVQGSNGGGDDDLGLGRPIQGLPDFLGGQSLPGHYARPEQPQRARQYGQRQHQGQQRAPG